MAGSAAKNSRCRQGFGSFRVTKPVKPASAYLSLFFFLFAVYLLTYTPRINSSDGLAMFSTAESLVRRGSFDIEQIRWMDLQQGTYGLDGLLYSRKGIGVPIALLPLTWLGLIIPWFGTVSVSLLFNAIVTALTAVVLMAYLQLLGFTARTGLIVALTFGLSTLAWPYAKSLFSDPFSGLLLLATAYVLLKWHKIELMCSTPLPQVANRGIFSPRIWLPFWAGLFLGWNVATRYAEALFLPVFGLLFLFYLYRNSFAEARTSRLPSPFGRGAGDEGVFSKESLLPLIAFVTPILVIGLVLISFNISRYGDPLNTGYLPNETFSGILWQGIIGQLISPGRGLLLYCPIFVMSIVGLWPMLWRARAETVVALSVIAIHLLLYGKWFMWHGGYAWGPRFMIPTLPFWAMLLGPVVEGVFSEGDWRLEIGDLGLLVIRGAFVALALLGLIPQLLSSLIDFAPFQNSLLETGLPLFAPATFFEWQYSPFVKAWAYVQPDTLDVVWYWQGRLNGWLLAILLANLLITGFALINGAARPARSTGSVAVALLSTLAAVASLLVYAHSLPPASLRQAVAVINEAAQPTDAIITNDPNIAMPLAELYKGRGPVLGLNNGGFPVPDEITRRLDETMARHGQIWWVPNWLPPEESAIEQTLLANGFRARQEQFDEQRLVLFAHPAAVSAQPLTTEARFDERIALVRVAFPPLVAPGAALPVELRWQGLTPITDDYRVFVHLLGADSGLIAQADGQPANWSRPTSTWAAGETVLDRHGLWVPAETAPGTYRLQIGLYRAADGQRLQLTDGSDAVSFEVEVGSGNSINSGGTVSTR